MRLFPSLLVVLGVALAIVGTALAFTEVVDPPPQNRPARDTLLVEPRASKVVVTKDLYRPWSRPAPVPKAAPVVPAEPEVVPEPEEVPEPTPVIEPPPPAVNRSALAFLGKVMTEDQVTRYFFKEKSSGFVVGLVPGETKGKWTLSQVDAVGYHLEGPGGLYEVQR